jgi:hypothetical protein
MLRRFAQHCAEALRKPRDLPRSQPPYKLQRSPQPAQACGGASLSSRARNSR